MTVQTPLGKITASKEVLVLLEGKMWDSYHYNRHEGFINIANEACDTADTIHEALKSKGVFDNIKRN